jgi:hypothetical protein
LLATVREPVIELGVGAGAPSSPPPPLLHPWIVILTCSTTVPPVTLVVVTPLLEVVVLVVKLELVIPVALQLPLATMGVVLVGAAGAAVPLGLTVVVGVRDLKRVKEPLPLS